PHPDEPPPRRARRGGARGAADPGRTARGPPDARFLADDAPPGSGDSRPDGVRSLVLAMRVGRELLSIMTPARACGGPPTVAAGSRAPLQLRRHAPRLGPPTECGGPAGPVTITCPG